METKKEEGHMLDAEMEDGFEGVAAAAVVSRFPSCPGPQHHQETPSLPARSRVSARRMQPRHRAPYLIGLPLTSIPPLCAFEFLFTDGFKAALLILIPSAPPAPPQMKGGVSLHRC